MRVRGVGQGWGKVLYCYDCRAFYVRIMRE